LTRQKIQPWVVVFSCFLTGFTCIGLGVNGLSLFYLPVTGDLGFKLTDFTVYYTITMLTTAVLSPFMGKLFTRHMDKLRLIMLIGTALTALCFFLYSRCSTLPAFYAVSVLRGIANAALSNTAATMVVNNWFVKRRSLAISLVFMGTSAGGMVYTQISRFFLESFGWRTSYWALGLVGLAFNLLMLLLLRPSPESVGLVPYGAENGDADAGAVRREGVPLRQALRTPSFWLLLFAMFIASITVQGTQQAVSSALQTDGGHTLAFASTVVSVFMVGLCVGKLIIGVIYDKKGLAFGIVYSAVLLVVSYGCVLLSESVPFALAFGVAFGLGNMMSSVTASTAVTEIFGNLDYGVIYGFIVLGTSAGNALGPVLSSAIYDGTGSFRAVWVLYAAIVAVATVLVIVAQRLMKKRRVSAP